MDVGKGKLRCSSQALRRAPVAVLVALAYALLPATSAAAETPPYEPNDAPPAAAGPLEIGGPYVAALESGADRDFYFFHVTSPQAAKVELTVQNLGGGSKVSDVDAAILDSTMTPVAAQTFIRDGEVRTVAAELEAQKYFVEVTANEGFGDSYSLIAGGSEGAFGPYAQISGRCASANAAAKKASRGLSRAKAKLQRATARLRRSSYTTPQGRERAQAAHRLAKQQVSAKRKDLRAAQRSMRPWCGIAP